MDSQSATSRRILLVDDDRGLRLALSTLLKDAGHDVETAGDGPEALALLRERAFDIVLLDIGLPSMSGLDVLAQARALATPPLVIMMTADDTPETVLESVRRQAFRYLRKPFPPNTIVEVVNDALGSAAGLSFEVVSARPEWLELVAPCSLEMADRIQSFVMQLDAHLPEDVREAVAYAFRELLTNAIEWGGKLDPESQGADLVRPHEEDAALQDRRPRRGIRHRWPPACRHLQPRRPDSSSPGARRAGASTGRLRTGDDPFARRRADLQRSAERSDLRQIHPMTHTPILNPGRALAATLCAVTILAAARMTAGTQAGAPQPLTITLTGQSMVRSDLRVTAPKAVPVIQGLLKGDVVFTNLEAAVALPGQAVSEGRGFLTPPETLDALKSVGFNLLSLSNNHAFDLQATGIQNTIREIERRQIVHAGIGNTLSEAAAPAY